ncbi:membrane protein [Jannaschia pagri]|uniref:Membrane protein n=1 Tax=Jannaschia pagri TaxID=2829797 RepID=A0ABQ4NNV4_9RHOB|nr:MULTISPECIES: MAPEG family protein [unclassified Jannaschia]GIT91938.1 membrane protein [Jannaschia sp. AI_61]GIT95772.1 membrane protein [Jannaschia sp. AI_62]
MTPELWWMTWTALLAASMWIPYIVGVNTEPKGEDAPDPFLRPPPLSEVRPWVHRAHRAHLNLLEQFLPMLAVVLIAHTAGISSSVTVWACGIFFAVRLLHAWGMIGGWARFPARPLLFLVGWVCVLAVGINVLVAG